MTFVTLFLLLANKVKWWLIVIATTVSVVGVTLVVVGVILSNCQDESKYKSAACITSQSPSYSMPMSILRTGPESMAVSSLVI